MLDTIHPILAALVQTRAAATLCEVGATGGRMNLLADVDRFSKLTGLIYAAALEPQKWLDVVDYLHHETGGIKTHIFGYDFAMGMDLGFVASGYDEEHVASFAEHYCHINPWAQGWMSGPVGVVTPSDEMCPRDELVKTEFYADWVRPQEDVIGGGGILVAKTEHRMFALGGNIRSRDDEKLGGDWLDLIGRLQPHLSQAFEISRALTSKSLSELAAAQQHDARPTAIVVASVGGHILYASHAARVALRDGTTVREDHLGRLCFASEKDHRIFEHALACLTRDHPCPPTSFQTGTTGDTGDVAPRLDCRIAPFHAHSGAPAGLGLLCGIDEPCLLLTLTAPSLEEDLVPTLVALHGLTPAEARVACALAGGLSIAQIAEQRGASVFTVRNQTKSAMSKCGVGRQVDLVRAVEAARRWAPGVSSLS